MNPAHWNREKELPAKGKFENRVVYPLFRVNRRYFERLSTARCYSRMTEGQPVEQWMPPELRVAGKIWEVVR